MSYYNRLEAGEPALSDALSGFLPTIDVLKWDYADYLKQASTLAVRAEMAISLSMTYMQDWGAQSLVAESETHQQDTVSALFIDTVSYFAADKLLQAQEDNGRNSTDQAYREALLNLLDSRRQLQDHLGSLLDAFPDSPAGTLFGTLATLAYEAICLIENEEDITSKDSGYHDLVGIISEHKVLAALIDKEFHGAVYGYSYEDMMHGEDIAIPSQDTENSQRVNLQVKTKKGGEIGLVIRRLSPGHLLVEVPFTNKGETIFSMLDEEAESLALAVAEEFEYLRHSDNR